MLDKVIRVLPNGDPKTGMEPSTMTDPASFLVSDPHETVHTPFTNAAGNVTAGFDQHLIDSFAFGAGLNRHEAVAKHVGRALIGVLPSASRGSACRRAWRPSR